MTLSDTLVFRVFQLAYDSARLPPTRRVVRRTVPLVAPLPRRARSALVSQRPATRGRSGRGGNLRKYLREVKGSSNPRGEFFGRARSDFEAQPGLVSGKPGPFANSESRLEKERTSTVCACF